jgi:hypothetical protein
MSVRILDYLRYRAEENESAQLWGYLICEKIKQAQCEVVIVLAQPNIIQQTEISLYSMEQSERHKLNMLNEDGVHLLKRCLNSY